MYALKDKVSEKLSRFFPESTSSPSDRQSQARTFANGGKSFTSYISNIIPSIGLDASRSDKNCHEFKLIPSQPVRYKSLNSKSQDEPLDNRVVSNTETETNQARAVKEKSEVINGNHSEVLEEAANRSISTKHLPNLMDESAFISPELYDFLFSSIPNIVKGCQWVLMYSTVKHGISLRTLIRRSANLSGPCLLIVGDKQGSVFGGLLDCPLKPTPKRKYQGTNQTFVFTTRYGEPRLFRPTGANRYYYLCLDELLAMGGGGNFALCLDGDLLNGTSGQCETFGNMCLAHKPEFELKNVELWGFTHASQYLT